jgi:hypothetical protein
VLACAYGVFAKLRGLAALRGSRVLGQVGIAASLSACVPMHHSIAPYNEDPVAARALEERAAGICAAVRGRGALPTYRFTTDGCSFWPDNGWLRCCIEHDIDYWCGGSAIDRCASDRRLKACAEAAGHGTVAQVMHFGTRLGGHPWVPLPWRWGYGWDWPYAYDDPAGRAQLRGSEEGCTERPKPAP